MKKVKYRNNSNNYNNQAYSINYKFDSISPAGKVTGTALDLIKRYNELAKEAQGNSNYVEAEVFRQYAEHYRKIITEINERKNLRFSSKENNVSVASDVSQESSDQSTNDDVATSFVSTSDQTPQEENSSPVEQTSENVSTLVETKPKQKSFTVIEVTDTEKKSKRVYAKKTKTDVHMAVMA